MMYEELVEIREATHPSDSEEAGRRPGSNGCDEICERSLLQLKLSPLGEPGPRSGDDKARRGKEVVFTQHEVSREVMRCPRIDERRSLWSDLLQQIAKLLAFDGVKVELGQVDERSERR
jgi:hypothetical protein